MYLELDKFSCSTFDLYVKATEILKYILPFLGKKNFRGQGTNYQVSGKFSSRKWFCYAW